MRCAAACVWRAWIRACSGMKAGDAPCLDGEHHALVGGMSACRRAVWCAAAFVSMRMFGHLECRIEGVPFLEQGWFTLPMGIATPCVRHRSEPLGGWHRTRQPY